MAAQDRYEPLNSIDESSFEAFYRIYLASMPARERKSMAFLAAMVARADYRMLLIKRKGEVIGFSVMFAPPEESFCLLEYMAVDVDYRGAGVGGRLFLRSVQDTARGRDDLAVLLEVDSEREPSADHAIRQRRQQFYRRLGCHRIDGLDYILPLPGAGAPLRYLLDRRGRSRAEHRLDHGDCGAALLHDHVQKHSENLALHRVGPDVFQSAEGRVGAAPPHQFRRAPQQRCAT